MVQDIELGTLTSSGWDTSSAPVASTANVWQSTSDPTVSADISIGVRRGDVWINTATGNEFRCISHAAGAAVWRHVPRVWQAGAAVSHTGNTTETALATITPAANVQGASGQFEIIAKWQIASSGNNKTARVRFNGIAGTAFTAIVQTTNTYFKTHTIIANRAATNSQIGDGGNGTGGWAPGTGADVTSAIDTTAVVPIVLSGELANGGDSITLNAYRVTLTRPDIGP